MYYRTIAASKSLEELESDIADEELGCSQFVECKASRVRVGAAPAKDLNLLKFQELEPGQIPAAPTLSLTPVSGGDLKWQGQMYVGKVIKVVYLYR